MKNYIISLEDTEKNTAAPKAKVDVVKYLEELGFVNKYLKFETDSSLKSKIQKYFALKITVPSFFKKHRDMDALVLQYPLYSTVITKAIIDNARKYTNAKLYFVIHDLESLRLFRDNKEFIREEVGILNGSDGLVGHNDKMNEWLKDNGVNVPIANLEIFDYDNPQEIQSGYPYDGSLCFAGNLKKADFLNRLDIKHQLFLMGPNPQNNYGECINYEGQYTPEEVPAHLNHSFGLVWDGKSVDKCDGVFGEYMRYNNPHKVSLYLSSGIPVIIWKDAALADFVEKNKVGITVESLEDVDSILDELSSEQYNEIKSNTQVIAEKMRSGYYIKKAIRQLIH